MSASARRRGGAPARAGRTTQDEIRRRYPGYEGPIDVYRLQLHIAMQVLEGIFERHLAPGIAVADLGCGSGTLLHELAPRVRSVVGVDLDDGAFWKYPDLDLRKGTLYELPLDTASVDLVTSKWVFEHLDDPGRAVAEIRRILRPGGMAIIAAPNVLHPTMLLSHVLPTGVKKRALAGFDGIQEDLVLPTYYRANTRRALRRWLGRAGLEEVEFAYWGDPSYWLFSAPLFRLADRGRVIGDKIPLLRPLRMNLVGVYRRAASC